MIHPERYWGTPTAPGGRIIKSMLGYNYNVANSKIRERVPRTPNSGEAADSKERADTPRTAPSFPDRRGRRREHVFILLSLNKIIKIGGICFVCLNNSRKSKLKIQKEI